MNPLRLVFYGTSDFAVPILDRLFHDGRFNIQAVVTQPDRPAGRHQQLEPSPIKKKAQELGLPVLQFEKIKSDEAFETLKGLKAEVAVVASFGQIIPQRILDVYPHGMVNVHASLLPKYRGASPIAAAIKEGEDESGVSIMLMDALMDHGPILAKASEPIQPTDNTPSLSARLATLGADILPNILEGYVKGEIKPQEQDHAQATSVKLLSREDGWIKPAEQTAEEIERMVRAYHPWPGTFLELDGSRLKVHAATVAPSSSLPPNTRSIENKKPAVACKHGSLLILEQVQPEGKKPLDGVAFLHGYKLWKTS
jgi:methionyl-tRNA formyltransferase